MSGTVTSSGSRSAGHLVDGGPRVVAVGGGHGVAVTLRAARHYAGALSAVVTVADDGGSSGRLRKLLEVPAVGDMRRCLSALAADPAGPLARSLEHRFSEGELEGHAMGNLLLCSLAETSGGLLPALAEVARVVDAVGAVWPATTEAVMLKARLRAGHEPRRAEVEGQVAISTTGPVEEVALVPADPPAPAEAVAAIVAADQVVLGPGSLFTSVLAAAVVPEIAAAIRRAAARRVYVCNLREQAHETTGFTVADHVTALERHGVSIDVVLCQRGGPMPVGDLPVPHVAADVATASGLSHDPGKLAAALRDLVG